LQQAEMVSAASTNEAGSAYHPFCI